MGEMLRRQSYAHHLHHDRLGGGKSRRGGPIPGQGGQERVRTHLLFASKADHHTMKKKRRPHNKLQITHKKDEMVQAGAGDIDPSAWTGNQRVLHFGPMAQRDPYFYYYPKGWDVLYPAHFGFFPYRTDKFRGSSSSVCTCAFGVFFVLGGALMMYMGYFALGSSPPFWEWPPSSPLTPPPVQLMGPVLVVLGLVLLLVSIVCTLSSTNFFKMYLHHTQPHGDRSRLTTITTIYQSPFPPETRPFFEKHPYQPMPPPAYPVVENRYAHSRIVRPKDEMKLYPPVIAGCSTLSLHARSPSNIFVASPYNTLRAASLTRFHSAVLEAGGVVENSHRRESMASGTTSSSSRRRGRSLGAPVHRSSSSSGKGRPPRQNSQISLKISGRPSSLSIGCGEGHRMSCFDCFRGQQTPPPNRKRRSTTKGAPAHSTTTLLRDSPADRSALTSFLAMNGIEAEQPMEVDENEPEGGLQPRRQYSSMTVQTIKFIYPSGYTCDGTYLGGGSYGNVVKAKMVNRMGVEKEVAIKKLHQPFSTVSHARRVYRELRLLQLMRHDNIIRAVDLYTPDEDLEHFSNIFIVTEYAGDSLYAVLKRQRDDGRTILTSQHSLFIIYSLLRALKYIHSASVMHRDLKPSNLAVTSETDVTVLDFGLARTIEENKNTALSTYVMTRWYRAPEVIYWKLGTYDKQADVWSVGCIAAELFCGRPLFPGDDQQRQYSMITELCGCPDEELLQKIEVNNSVTMREVIARVSRDRPRVDFYSHFRRSAPDLEDEAIDFLDKVLVLDPARRLTVEQALEHPYLAMYHKPEDEPNASEPFAIDDDKKIDNINEWKRMIWDDIRNFRGDQHSPSFP